MHDTTQLIITMGGHSALVCVLLCTITTKIQQ